MNDPDFTMNDPDFTLSAGPVTASARTLAALGSPITYHYDPAFLDCFRRTERKVAQILQTVADVVLMQGEAVLGLEAGARALVRPGTPVLNLVSGIFGKGMGHWLRDFGADVRELEVAYNDAVDAAEVERFLESHPQIEVVAVVHSETPSGTLNPVAEIGPIARAHGALTLVDCVSSVGGIPFKADEWQLDVCVAGPQKCLGGPPGMSLMSVSEEAWTRIRQNPAAPRASFLSLLDWKEQWLEGGKFPFTPSVSDVHGVEAACDQLLEEELHPARTDPPHEIFLDFVSNQQAADARVHRETSRLYGYRRLERSSHLTRRLVRERYHEKRNRHAGCRNC